MVLFHLMKMSLCDKFGEQCFLTLKGLFRTRIISSQKRKTYHSLNSKSRIDDYNALSVTT